MITNGYNYFIKYLFELLSHKAYIILPDASPMTFFKRLTHEEILSDHNIADKFFGAKHPWLLRTEFLRAFANTEQLFK